MLKSWYDRLKRAAILFVTMAPSLAFAHGDAMWIQNEPSYITKYGGHCCGPTDCRRAHKGEVVEVPGGVTIGGQYVAYNDVRVYWSIDDEFWFCQVEGEVRCIFRPRRGDS